MEKRLCTRCISNESLPGISFGVDGVCSYCITQQALEKQYPIGAAGEQKLNDLAVQIKKAGRGKKYDCVIGVSGGADSSYLLHLAVKQLGLRPLAVHFDNTWNTDIATQNIYIMLKALNIDLYTHVVDNREYDDIYKSFLKAGVKDIDIPTDIGLITTLYRAASKNSIKYILDGHSFRTEGIVPTDFVYMDGKYIESVHDAYGNVPLNTYPNLRLARWLTWMIISGIKRSRPLYYLKYDKEEIKKFLNETYGWQWYGGKHMENRFTIFAINYYLYKRFNIDLRVIEYSGLIRSGQLTRDEALEKMKNPPAVPSEVLQLITKRLGYSADALEQLIKEKTKTYRDFPTYKPFFERWKFFFFLLYKLDLVPHSFYVKYTKKD